MQTALDISLIILLLCLVHAGWIGSLLGLPGNWLIVGVAAVGYFFVPDTWRSALSLQALWISVGAALLGEFLEFIASALGVKKQGGSTRGSVGAIIGSIVGVFLGMALGSPVPIVGNIVMAVLCGCGGAWCGAILAERSLGKSWDESHRIGVAAFWGKLFGTLGKAICGIVAACWVSIELVR